MVRASLAAFSMMVGFWSQSALSDEMLPCGIMLKFGQDATGSVANYTLSAQVKNPTGRSVSGVSVLFYNTNDNLLGNTELNCKGRGHTLEPGSTGQCSMLLQTIDGKMMENFGTEMWTAIVNVQLQKLNSISKCQLLGFRYTNQDRLENITSGSDK